MLYRFIIQSSGTFYSGFCNDSIITHFRHPLGVYSIDEVFDDKPFVKRMNNQIDNIPQILRNLNTTNHIIIPIALTYSQFLDQYPEWNI